MPMQIDELNLEKIEQRPQTLRLIALERMRDAILEGRLAPGERLVERALSERLGVSRSVVREVIRNLESEGLVETAGGPRLASITLDEARQIYEIRTQLESSAAAACAAHTSQDLVAELHKALADIGKAHESGSAVAALRATTHFYEVLFLGSGHTIAWEIVQRLNGRISRLRAVTLSSGGRQAAGLSQMRQIVDAIEAGEGDRAAHAARAHLEAAARIAFNSLLVAGS